MHIKGQQNQTLDLWFRSSFCVGGCRRTAAF